MATAKVNYALAPAGATHYDFFDGRLGWLKFDQVWFYFDNDVYLWGLCEQDEQPENEKEIPERERVLNRLADHLKDWPRISKEAKIWLEDTGFYWRGSFIICNENKPNEFAFVRYQWQQRRAERIEAGLIEIDNPVTSSVTNSQAKEMGLDMLKGEKWLPEVGEICEATWGTKTDWCQCCLGQNNMAWVKNTHNEQWQTFKVYYDWEFRPLKTPEQKARDAFKEWYLFPKTAEPMWEQIFNHMSQSGVDLTPLIKEQE